MIAFVFIALSFQFYYLSWSIAQFYGYRVLLKHERKTQKKNNNLLIALKLKQNKQLCIETQYNLFRFLGVIFLLTWVCHRLSVAQFLSFD